MRCQRVLRRIDDHVDGLLPAEEAERVRDHLDACGDCRETAFAARAASTSLAAWGDLDPPDRCFDSILAKIDALPPDAVVRAAPRRSAAGRILRFALPAAAAAAAVVAAFLVVDQGRAARSPSRGPAAAALPVAAMLPQPVPSLGVLRPGEEYIHRIGDVEWDGVRRARGGVRAVPVDRRERRPAAPFGIPR